MIMLRQFTLALVALLAFGTMHARGQSPDDDDFPDDAGETPIEQPADRCWWLPSAPVAQPTFFDLFAGRPVPVGAALPQLPSIQSTITSAAGPSNSPGRATPDPWTLPVLRPEGLKQVASANSATDFANLSAQVKLREHDIYLDPAARNAWEADQTVKVPVASSVFLFNQVTGSTPAVEQQQYKWLTKTGVGLKLKPPLFQEVQLRTGPAVRYDDTGTLSKGQSPERSELFVEAVTKVPIPMVGPINLEYTSYAVPANAVDRNQINQDFKLALPFAGGQFHVGAKYKWESATATPWMDRMELYLGVQNKW
jgi:hypothetical protein